MSKRLTTEEFINRAISIHGDKYDYSQTIYINAKTKVKIKCKKHGIFEQTPSVHIHQQCGCHDCSIEHKVMSNTEFVSRSQTIHNSLYTYGNTNYTHNTIPVIITCKIHGNFKQTPHSHLKGQGCPQCAIDAKSLSSKEFIDKSNIIHNHIYNYSKTKYVNKRTKVCILCKTHGEFWQLPHVHTRGCGCPKCKRSLGEELISKFLISNNISFETEKQFEGCVYEHHLLFDFYIESINLCIEFDGKQHFKPITYFGGEPFLKKQKVRDAIKDEYCINNNIHLLRIPYTHINNINDILLKELHLT